MKLFKRSCWLFLGILMLGLMSVPTVGAESKASVDSVKITSSDDAGFNAAIESTGNVEYKVSSFDNPPRIMVSFPGLPASEIVAKQIINEGNVRNVRAFYIRPGQLNAVIFDLQRPAAFDVSKDAGVIKVAAKNEAVKAVKAVAKAAPKAVVTPKVDQSAKAKAKAELEAKKEAEHKAAAKAKAKAEAEKASQKEEQRLAKEKAKAELEAKKEAERKARAEAKAKAKAELEAKKEAERKAELEAKKAKEEAKAKAKAEKARKKEEARLAKEKAKAERKAKKEAERKARAEAKAKAKAEREAKKEAERKAELEAKKAKEEAKAKAEAEKAQKKEEERLAKEKAKADEKRKEEEKAEQEKAQAALMPVPAPSVFQKEEIKKEVINNLKLSLDDCIKIGVRNNRKLKIALEEVVLAKLKVDEAKRGLYPKFIIKSEVLSGETTAKFDGGHYGAEIQMPLYAGGKLQNTLKQSKVNLAVALMNFKKEKNEFVLGVQQAYLTLASAAKRAELKKKLADEADSTLDEMKKRHEIGTVRDLELLDLQVQHVDIMAELDTINDDVELAQTALINVLGVNDDSKVGVVGFPEFKQVDVDYDQILKLALKNRPEVRINELLVDFHQYGVEIAKSDGRLKADFSGSYGYGDEYYRTEGSDFQPEWFFGIKMGKTLGLHNLENNFISQDKVPASGQTTSTKFWNNTTQLTLFANNSMITVKEAKIKYQKAVDEQKNALDSLASDVRKSYFEYVRSLRSLDSFDLKMKYGQKEVEIISAQKDINQAVSSDVLKAQSHFLNTQSELIKARENAFTAAFKLNKEIGITDYINPVAGKLDEGKIPGDDVDFSNAEAEIAWYKFWSSSAKENEKRWLARYPEIVEATDLVKEEGYKQTSGWNFDYNHDYSLVAIDEPLTPAQLEEKAEEEQKALEKKQAEEKKAAAEQAKAEAKRKKAEEKAKKREAEKLAKEQAKAEKAQKEEQARIASEKAKAEKAQKKEEARLAKEKAKAERAAKKEAERKARAEAKAKAKAEKAQKREAERLAKEQAKAMEASKEDK